MGPDKSSSQSTKARCFIRRRASVFQDAEALTFDDPDHSDEESREMTIGLSTKGRVPFLSHCERGDGIRIISAIKATPKERKQYAEGLS